MEFRDYYAVMGVSRDATQEEIKRAYRKLARKYHPDVSKEPDAEARFKELGEAYEVLGDPEKRAAYDELGSQWKAGEEFRPPPDWQAGFEFSGASFGDGDAGEASDFFEALFGRRFRQGHADERAWQPSGPDHHARVLVDLEDAFSGGTRRITLRSPVVEADGRVRTREHQVDVRIPRGIVSGQVLRVPGQGAPGPEGKAGDLYLEVRFRPHPHYRVADRDLYLDVPVTPWEAALGESVRVPTPGGVVDLRIPPGTGSGRQLRLKGRGLPASPPGDLYAVIRIVVPPATNEPARQLFLRMKEELPFNPRRSLGV